MKKVIDMCKESGLQSQQFPSGKDPKASDLYSLSNAVLHFKFGVGSDAKSWLYLYVTIVKVVSKRESAWFVESSCRSK